MPFVTWLFVDSDVYGPRTPGGGLKRTSHLDLTLHTHTQTHRHTHTYTLTNIPSHPGSLSGPLTVSHLGSNLCAVANTCPHLCLRLLSIRQQVCSDIEHQPRNELSFSPLSSRYLRHYFSKTCLRDYTLPVGISPLNGAQYKIKCPYCTIGEYIEVSSCKHLLQEEVFQCFSSVTP